MSLKYRQGKVDQEGFILLTLLFKEHVSKIIASFLEINILIQNENVS